MTRRTAVLAALALVVTLAGVAIFVETRDPRPLGVSGDWEVLLDEEFDGSELDRDVWSEAESWEEEGRSADEAWLPVPTSERQVQVSDGRLRIKARRADGLPEGRAFTSAHINSREHFTLPADSTTFTEGRLNVPSGNGLLPQFWLLGQGDESTGEGWPTTGEVDLLELANANTGEFTNPYFSVWYPRDVYTAPPGTFMNATHVTHPDSFDRRPELFAGWHTWGLYRSPERMDLYIDGEKAFTFEPGETYGGEEIPLPEMLFTNEMHLRLSLGVGGDWAGQEWEADDLQQGDLQVDHVRVWERDAS